MTPLRSTPSGTGIVATVSHARCGTIVHQPDVWMSKRVRKDETTRPTTGTSQAMTINIRTPLTRMSDSRWLRFFGLAAVGMG